MMIAKLWSDHYAAPFPKECAGEQIEDIDLVLLDADVTGCISVFLQNGGKLDHWRTAILGLCYRHLAIVVRNLSGEAQGYFWRLETLAGLVLEAVRDETRQD